MEERKSINQVENTDRDFQFSADVAENASQTRAKQYGRDILLQLRLHPLSLQKPKDLPGMDVVKEKLYLHDINETSPDRHLDNNHASFKPEYCNMKHEYPLLPHYLNRLYPYCFLSHGYNGSYQSTSSKFRPSYHAYCNPLKKHCATSHHCYKDFAEECLWPKRCFPSNEDIWNCYPSLIKKKEHMEAIPKSKKNLPIIDPITGKNVLETIAIHEEDQSGAYHVQGNSESCESFYSYNDEDKCTGDFINNDNVNDGQLEISNKTFTDCVTCPSEDKTYCDKLKDSCTPCHEDYYYNKFEANPNFQEAVYDDKPTVTSNMKTESSGTTTKDETTTSTADSTVVVENRHEVVKNFEKVDESCDASKTANKKIPKICQNRENSHTDKHGNCQAHYRKDMYVCKDSLSKQNDLTRESFKSKDKLSVRQEQQKMAILQSFLRYKKYQLEESARNLDEKRMEIANWECNLYNKAKRLHDKEIWLESQSEILFNKAQQLADREKMLNKEEGNLSVDCAPSNSMSKASNFLERKNVFYNYSDAAWDEIPSKSKTSCKNDETNDYSYFGACASNSNKITEDVVSNIDKYKSEAKSLDELEKNIVFIEKIHSSSEIGDTSLESKPELSSNASQKKDEIDPLGYSKGRRYLPEHIKYWLNKRDKNSL